MVETWSPSRCVAVEAPGGGGQKQAAGSRVWEGAAGKVARAITTPTPLQNTEKDCTRLHARQMLSACKCNHSVGQKMNGLDLGSGGETHGNSSSPFRTISRVSAHSDRRSSFRNALFCLCAGRRQYN